MEIEKGLSREVVKTISEEKNEPKWMRTFRLKSLEIFFKKPMPDWGPKLDIDFDNITYYIKPTTKKTDKWEDLPPQIKRTFDRLGVPEAERKFLAGAGAQFDSENVLHKIKEGLAKRGVIFSDIETGLQEQLEIIKKHFSTVVPPSDNKFAALNSAVWSGGSFVYIPEGVKVDLPLNAYFRINAQRFGQLERTLIIAEPDSSVHYVEGCSAPLYSGNSLHAAVVEVIAKQNSRVRYTTIQNWSKNIYNLVTKRAHAHQGAIVEWVDGNLGSVVTMKYPCVYLMGENAKADILSIALASKSQNQDTGAKVIHGAPNTSSTIISKSISKDNGKSVFRGLVRINKGCTGSKSHMRCDALILDKESKSDTIPMLQINEKDVAAGHEATVGKIGEEQLFYLMSRGLTEQQAVTLIVNGFFQPFIKQLPMEYAVELNRLIELEMEESTG